MIKNFLEKQSAKSKLKQIMTGEWKCKSCEDLHSGLFDLAAFKPDFWNGAETYALNKDVTLKGDFLSEDFCVINGESFFVRCVLEFPIKGFDERFGFGVWSTLSKTNFEKYINEFDSGNFDDETFWSSWFSNSLNGIENTIKQKCWVHPLKGRQRPLIYFMDKEHPVTIAQENGIEPKWLLDIIAANGHSI